MTAATLGTGRIMTGQERINFDAAKEEKYHKQRRGNDFSVIEEHTSDEEEDSNAQDLLLESMVDDGEREARIAAARALFSSGEQAVKETGPPSKSTKLDEAVKQSKANDAPPAIGSALALGLDGKPATLVMRKRRKPQKTAGHRTAWGRVRAGEAIDESEDDYDDFDSSESSEGEQGESLSEKMNEGSSEEADAAVDSLGTNVGAEQNWGDDESASCLSDSDVGSIDDTDEEEQAILEEAMRRRGMLGDPSRPVPDFESEEQRPAEEDEALSEPESLLFATFDDDQSQPGVEVSGCEEESGEEEVDEDEEDGHKENDDEEEGWTKREGQDKDRSDSDEYEAATQSRRRGLPSTKLSQGFKDWAKEALGLGGPAAEVEDDGVYRGPVPVAGLTSRVGDLMDGKIRGPLGADEPTMQERSAFAQKYYQEVGVRKDGKANNDNIHVSRSEQVQEARLGLPVLAEEERIVRVIMENMVTVLCGETGSGKTTQVPQFLYEAGFGTPNTNNPGMVGITQPRRVAALSMAARVAKELDLPPSKISHQIRYDANVSPSTSIKFMTDGVLLRELAADFLLTKYSAVVIDEAHERSVNTDVLIGVLSRVVKLRARRWMEGQGRPLRMIIMSATLRVEDFVGNVRLFDEPPPVVEIDARQHPVVTHFNRRTSHDYVTESVKKASKIHARLPPGGILIFLTGQAEIAVVCRKLEKRYGRRTLEARQRESKSGLERNGEEVEGERVRVTARDGDVEAEEVDLSLNPDLAPDVDDGRVEEEDAEALDTDDEADEEDDYDADLPAGLRDDSDVPMHILPLYSLLPSDRQMRVFDAPPPNTRLVVVATNVAETSLTIPGITYVVDCGRSKERKYDPRTGVQSFEVGFISKASANQRAGRAGRTGPGHCYRLYSSNVYEEQFASFSEAEILRIPVDNLVLMMKSMNIDNVANFPFPTPPNREALHRAEKLLLRLGALEADSKGSQVKVTELGRAMSLFPLSTRLSKLLVQGHQFDCMPFVVALVAALSVGDPFLKEESLHEGREDDDNSEQGDMPVEAQHINNRDELEREKQKAKRRRYFGVLNQLAALSGALSDPLRLLSAVGAYEHEGGTQAFCHKHFLLPKAMQEIHKLRAQLSAMVQANAEAGTDWSHLNSPAFKAPPTAKQLTVLRQFLTAAFVDQVAIRADLAPESAARVEMLQESTSSDYRIAKQFQHQLRNGAKMTSTRDVAYLAIGIPREACFIHKTSVLFHQSPPDWIVFSDVFRGKARGEALEVPGRNWLKGVTKINPNWIHKLGRSLCTFSKTIEIDAKDTRAALIEAAKEVKRRQGEARGASGAGQRQAFVVPTYGNGPAFDLAERSSHLGWELPAVMARQRLVAGRWVTELV